MSYEVQVWGGVTTPVVVQTKTFGSEERARAFARKKRALGYTCSVRAANDR